MSAAPPLVHRRRRRASRAAAVATLACLVGVGATSHTAHASTPETPASASWAPVEGEAMNYAVNAGTGAAATSAAHDAVVAAGGRVLVAYPEIGVTIAQSTRAAFATDIENTAGIDSAGPTRTRAVTDGSSTAVPGPLAETVATSDDPDLPDEGAAWNDAAARTTAAHTVTTGSPEVVVGIADSGIDDTHPDLIGRIDPSRSVGCSMNGVANTDRAAWLPDEVPHGTHVAGTVGAARNGSGIVGVAPSTTLASIKVGVDGAVYAEYVICGIMWAAAQGMDVVNHSYFIGPWLGWCPDQASQAAGLEAARRAFAYATSKNVLSVAASGNDSVDFDVRAIDAMSPYDSTPQNRPVTSACTVPPAGFPGVLGVAASASEAGSGDTRYAALSNYGGDTVDIVAPGVAIWSSTPPQGNSLYAPYPGTSMAAPHVTGAAALIKSMHPNATPAEITAILKKAARPGTCPGGKTDCPDADPRRMGAGHLDVAASLGVATPDSEPTIGITSRKMLTTEDNPIVATGFRPGESVDLRLTQGSTVQNLATAVADKRGEVHASVRVAATTGTEEVTLSAVGRTSTSSASTGVRVAIGLEAPTVTSPTADSRVPAGVLTVSGRGAPGATVRAFMTKPTWNPNTDGALPKPPPAAEGEPVPFDPSTGLTSTSAVADATGVWSVSFRVPADAYSVYAMQYLDGVLSATGPAVAFEALSSEPTATPSAEPTAGTGGSIPDPAEAAANGSSTPTPDPGTSSSATTAGGSDTTSGGSGTTAGGTDSGSGGSGTGSGVAHNGSMAPESGTGAAASRSDAPQSATKAAHTDADTGSALADSGASDGLVPISAAVLGLLLAGSALAITDGRRTRRRP
jgi:subtilisin family serine protease